MKVLIIEDDVQLNIAISEFFKIKSFDTVSVKDGLKAIDQIDSEHFDLYIIDINIPPLRERKSDLPFLIQHFLKIYSDKYSKDNIYLSEQTKDILNKYDYPGNVRELENIIQRAVALVDGGKIEPKHLQANINSTFGETPNNKATTNYKDAKNSVLEKFELDYVTECLKTAHGNISKAARIADIQYAKFHNKIKKYKIKPSAFKS